MTTISIDSTFEALIEHLLKTASPQQMLDFFPSEEADEHVRDLLEANNAGTLTSDDRQELERMLQVNRLITIMKAKALQALKSSEQDT